MKFGNGFTLIELTVALVVIGLLVAGAAKAFDIYMKKLRVDTTKARISEIEDALRLYVHENGRYPCPAPIDAARDSAAYAQETNCAGAPAAGVSDVSGHAGRRVRIGAVPARALGIADTVMTDGWRNRFTYAVSVNLARPDVPFNNSGGAITITDVNDNTVANGAAHFALISHGPDGKGARAEEGGLVGSCTGGQGKDRENCAYNDAVFRISNERSTAPGAGYFDDFGAYAIAVERDQLGAILACNARMMFYNPAHPDADADGCVTAPEAPPPEIPDIEEMLKNFCNGIRTRTIHVFNDRENFSIPVTLQGSWNSGNKTCRLM